MVLTFFALFKSISYGHLLLSISMLGEMSMNMWLIHLLFIVYGIHFRNPFVDLVWIYLVSLVAAYVIWCVYHKLCECKW